MFHSFIKFLYLKSISVSVLLALTSVQIYFTKAFVLHNDCDKMLRPFISPLRISVKYRSRIHNTYDFPLKAAAGASRLLAISEGQDESPKLQKVKNMRVDRILVNRGMSGRKSIQKMVKQGRVLMVVDPNDPSSDVVLNKADEKIPGMMN